MSLSTYCFLVAGLVYSSISHITILQLCYCNMATMVCIGYTANAALCVVQNWVVKKVKLLLSCHTNDPPVEKQTNTHLHASQNLWLKKKLACSVSIWLDCFCIWLDCWDHLPQPFNSIEARVTYISAEIPAPALEMRGVCMYAYKYMYLYITNTCI